MLRVKAERDQSTAQCWWTCVALRPQFIRDKQRKSLDPFRCDKEFVYSRVIWYYHIVWLSTEAVAFFTPRPPFFSLLASFVSSHLLLFTLFTLSARLSKLEDYGFDQLVSQCNWHHLLNEKSGFWGTCLSWRDVRSWLYEGCGRGGKSNVWRLFPWRTMKISTYSVPW